MQIRFLQTYESEAPDYPFQAGQIITVPSLTNRMKDAVKSGAAEIIREIREEFAVTRRRKGNR
jgi:hypothetical protein